MSNDDDDEAVLYSELRLFNDSVIMHDCWLLSENCDLLPERERIRIIG
jgi:hypothetical protein